ncbi:hypothetical protein ACJIZ3_004550 [Penstemon smallii]|uniref:RING-type E3 ubiquitin transferase n=1 Tax=Penstemon smallii TaxID=265156 RepID=A0ABD3S2F1_9LAMI
MGSSINQLILLVVVILAIIIFIFGLLQLLIKCVKKSSPSFSSISQSNQSQNSSNTPTFQRQLQQLFQLHDSGLDQALIDTLPIFYYKEIMGLKEPFDCAVCLCEFTDWDKLKLLPNCSHAFHIQCIETWLLSNSTCPLCRSLIDFETLRVNESFADNCGPSPTRICSVQLGKLRKLNEGLDIEEVSTSTSSIDARRCFSMGAFEYIVGDWDLQVALSSGNCEGQFGNSAEIDCKRINPRSRDESLSVSKIWLWSKKGKFHTSSSEIVIY